MRSEAEMVANHSQEETFSKKMLVLNHTNSPNVWADQSHQEMESTSNHASTQMMDKNRKVNRRVNNANRERVRQKHIREAFHILRAIIPDYFSQREPGDKLSRIKTLRLAKKYIVMLSELLKKQDKKRVNKPYEYSR